MLTTDVHSTEEQDKAKVEAILTEFRLPPEIARVEIRSGQDSTGDPALWVVLWVSKDLEFEKQKATQIYAVAEEVQTRMLAGGLGRFPYIMVDQAA